jgi:hypothetical protein
LKNVAAMHHDRSGKWLTSPSSIIDLILDKVLEVAVILFL